MGVTETNGGGTENDEKGRLGGSLTWKEQWCRKMMVLCVRVVFADVCATADLSVCSIVNLLFFPQCLIVRAGVRSKLECL